MESSAWVEWWRWQGWPSADEWTALWTALTLAAAVAAALVAYFQFHHNREDSRRRLEREAQLREDQIRRETELQEQRFRPIVIVDWHFRSNLVAVEVRNVGATPARHIRLRWSTIPAAVDPKRHQRFVRHLVDDEIPFLAPSRSVKYMLFRFDAYPEDAPRRFEVSAQYLGADDDRTWESGSILDLDQWGESLMDIDHENRMWNETRRQRETADRTGRETARAATALTTLAEYVETTPEMQRLREQQRAAADAEEQRWREEMPRIEQRDRDQVTLEAESGAVDQPDSDNDQDS